ncbi:MAG TPA: TIGR02452 family protein [Nannocystis sp.]
MRDPRDIRRSVAAAQGAEAVAIAQAGCYTAPSGRVVDVQEAIAAAVAGTRDLPPDQAVMHAPTRAHATRIEVCNESTLAAARRLVGADPVALNFASAYNPGGGFLGGARAQEESLCRASALHACIVGRPMYAHHSAHRDPMYTAWLMYSPGVPVFRDDDGMLLETPWTCGFITAAAPNVKVLRERSPERLDALPAVMTERITRVLGVAAREGHASVVLGAWGCGAFGGDTGLVAECFHAALHGPFHGVFATVVFAVLDSTAERRFIGPFERMFV